MVRVVPVPPLTISRCGVNRVHISHLGVNRLRISRSGVSRGYVQRNHRSPRQGPHLAAAGE